MRGLKRPQPYSLQNVPGCGLPEVASLRQLVNTGSTRAAACCSHLTNFCHHQHQCCRGRHHRHLPRRRPRRSSCARRSCSTCCCPCCSWRRRDCVAGSFSAAAPTFWVPAWWRWAPPARQRRPGAWPRSGRRSGAGPWGLEPGTLGPGAWDLGLVGAGRRRAMQLLCLPTWRVFPCPIPLVLQAAGVHVPQAQRCRAGGSCAEATQGQQQRGREGGGVRREAEAQRAAWAAGEGQGGGMVWEG